LGAILFSDSTAKLNFPSSQTTALRKSELGVSLQQ